MLFTGVRGRGFLRTSPQQSSRKFVPRRYHCAGVVSPRRPEREKAFSEMLDDFYGLEVGAMRDGLKVLMGALGGALLVLLLVAGFSGGGGMGYGMMGGMGHMMSGGMIGALFTLLFWGLLIILIVVVVVWIVGQSQRR